MSDQLQAKSPIKPAIISFFSQMCYYILCEGVN